MVLQTFASLFLSVFAMNSWNSQQLGRVQSAPDLWHCQDKEKTAYPMLGKVILSRVVFFCFLQKLGLHVVIYAIWSWKTRLLSCWFLPFSRAVPFHSLPNTKAKGKPTDPCDARVRTSYIYIYRICTYNPYTYVLESVGVFAVFALRWHPWKMSVNLGAVTIICDANRRHPPCMQFLVWVDQILDRFQPWLRTGFITSRAVILRIFWKHECCRQQTGWNSRTLHFKFYRYIVIFI